MASVPAIRGQVAAPRPSFDSFEVATIKPGDPEGVSSGRFLRMRTAHQLQVKNYTVEGLIAAAWDLNPKAISGAPAWATSERYDIAAATPGEVRPLYDEQMRMLRKLLEDRFSLRFHRGKKEFAIYQITVAPGGAKLKPSTAPPDEPYNVTSTMFPATSGGIDHALLPAHNVTIGQFASVLQRAILDRPVVDATGLAGRFDFNLEWTPGEREFGGQLPPGAPDAAKPELFSAMRDQLGLTLRATRGPVDTLIVDSVSRPSDN